MRIAVPFEDGKVFAHFGKTEQFKIYETEDGRITSTIVVSSEGQGHGALAEVLAGKNIDLVICGGIGEGALAALAAKGIKAAAGAGGDADQAVLAWLAGTFAGTGEVCDHHHEEGEGCGEECGSACEGQAGCGGCCGRQAPTVTGKNAGKLCVVHYRGTFDDGTQFDSSYDRNQPLEYQCGAGMMIHGFDQAVSELDPGQKVKVHLKPEEAYGMPDPRAVITVAIKDLPGSEDLTVGERVALADEYGRQMPVRVAAKDETTVTLDANHEMAGKELNFEIELVEVKG